MGFFHIKIISLVKKKNKNFNNLLKFYNFKIDLNNDKKFKTKQLLNKFSKNLLKFIAN